MRPLAMLRLVRLSDVKSSALYGSGYYRTLIGNPVLEVEPTGPRDRIRPSKVSGLTPRIPPTYF